MVNLTEGMLLACVRVLSISRCDRNMLRSPFSMYSVTMHSGSDDTHTQQSDDVGVIQTRHNLYFLQEVVPDRRTDKGEEAFPDLFFNSKEPTTGMYFSVLQRSLMHR